MATKEQVEQFRANIASAVEFQAGRLESTPKHKPHDAAAVLLSVLNILQAHASVRSLDHNDLQVAINTVMTTLDIEEAYTPMGALVYRKRTHKAKSRT
ncbi:MAG TPA: hypothetical protein PLL30_16965 [Candidatus Krumholzibacteria bacterium]|nr:hypothetical protein [Verrucomicrobiota bacterium]HPD73466.1 hypothetical protein [Candidatus Krumholzibacteria bacterium]HRY42189.1 hypothetical protein [Candidatus Krumholzibacteria bacterium]